MEDDDNWGLQAVVRSCGGATAAAAAAASSSCSCSTSSSSSSCCFSTSLATAGAARWTGPFFGFAPSNPPPVKEEEASARGHHTQLGGLWSEPDDLDPLGELEELFKPFLTKPVSHCEPLPAAVTKEEAGSPPRPLPFSTTSVLAAVAATVGGGNPSSGRRPLAARQQQQPRPRGMCHGVTNSRSKRRKNLVKKVVCQVPADALCSDVWAWRKYGQKPIKGSPFPRGYYRCSSSKGCPARKQVERSRTDPGMFVITYTSEHNHAVPTHRSCLAGSTRHKSPPRPPSSVLAAAPSTSDDAAACSNPSTSSCGKSSVSYSPLSSVEEELLLPVVPEDAVMGPATGGSGGSVGMDDEDGLLVVSGMDMDEMLDGAAEECCSGGSCDDDDDDELLLLAAGF